MNREERLGQAGEFVIGLMEDPERLEFEASLATDIELRRTVDAFAARLHSLDSDVAPAHVPETLWAAIETAIAHTPQEQPALPSKVIPIAAATRLERAPRPPASVLMALAASLLIALSLGYLAGAGLVGRAEPIAIAVLFNQSDGAPGAIAEAFEDGSVRLNPLQAFVVPEGRIMQVWTLPDAETGPVSLGTLARSAAKRLEGADLPAPKEGQLYEITLEPAPGSPTGRPTGPILAKGFAKLTSKPL